MAKPSAPQGALDAVRPHVRPTAPPRVRTYHARRGRLSSADRAALSTLSERWSLDAAGELMNPVEVFGRDAPLVLDVGCGMGESTRAQASADLGADVVALDVHTRGVAALLRGIERDGLTNVRVVLGDAVTFVEQRIPVGVLSGVRIYFPDPWHKARHAKRRMIQPGFVALLSSRLAFGGFVHCTTDDPDYAKQMRDVFEAAPSLEVHATVPADVGRPVTKFERRAQRLGRPIVDIWVTRTLSP